jgi:hypothetical protein
MMFPAIDNPVSCDAICFLRTENVSAVDICHELRAVYIQNEMSEGTVRQWHRMTKDG